MRILDTYWTLVVQQYPRRYAVSKLRSKYPQSAGNRLSSSQEVKTLVWAYLHLYILMHVRADSAFLELS